jgi:hypothetical protein
LIDQDTGQDEQRQDNKSSGDASVHSSTSDSVEWKFPCEHDEAEDHVDHLKDGDRLYCVIEVLGPHVEEDFRPEDAVKSCCELALSCMLVLFVCMWVREYMEEVLTDGSSHDDETGPVVLDKLSHFDLKISLSFA